ncbi:MAG: antitoxin family protein [Leptolyngbyaceae cyanobacterium bins.302]|nr:antitoxin family protein [Leptolyngbyaceae cyanobacterium bins.302]
MTITTEAVYEQGVLKLVQPIPLAEGTRVEVTVVSTQLPRTENPSEILAKIAALPLEGHPDQFSGRNHDAVLYPPTSET